MTGLEQGMGGGVVAAVLVALVLGAGLGAALRAVVLARVEVSADARARALGSAWVNVPASALASALLVWQARLDLLPGAGPLVPSLAVVLLLGLCAGASTWSTLALELARTVLAGDRQALVLQAGGAALGVLGGVFGAGLAVVGLVLVA